MNKLRLAPWLPILLLTACTGSREEVGVAARMVVLDAAHGGHPGFYFLPPLVPPTTLPPTFDGSLQLTARLEGPSGAPIVALPLLAREDHYQAHLDTEGLTLDPTVGYRLTVAAGARDLGHADVHVYLSEHVARSSASDDAFELVDGKKLPIKVYVNLCGMVDCAPATACRAAATCEPLDGSCVEGAPAEDGTACGDDGGTCHDAVCVSSCNPGPNPNCGAVGDSKGTECCQVGDDQKVCCGVSKQFARRLCTGAPVCSQGGTYPSCTGGEYTCRAGWKCAEGCCNECGSVGPNGCRVCEGPSPFTDCSLHLEGGACRATVNGQAR